MTLEISDVATRAVLAGVQAAVERAGGRAVLVGGCVRDAVLGRPAVDIDVEVFGVDAELLPALLEGVCPLDRVGQAFGVLKLRGVPIDVALPRRESKAGLGHRAFDVLSDPSLTFEEAASRRDFTINAMGIDLASGRLLDPFGGAADLAAKVLRHTSDKFAEDPLRVLRAMQFLARFELSPAPETVTLCAAIEPEGLPRERVFEEWRKLVVLGRAPSRGLAFLRDCGWVRYFPELAALIGCAQDPAWHPEGDVWIHTLHCMDAFAAARTGEAREDLIVGLAVLCHDLGKPATTAFQDGRWRSLGHDVAGTEPTRAFLDRLTGEKELVAAVVPLVVEHLRPVELYLAGAGPSAVRRLSARVERIDRLVRVARADQEGRPPIAVPRFEAGEWLLAQAHALGVAAAAPRPLVMGRHLIQLGLAPGKDFKRLLDLCYEAQLDGRITSVAEGLELVRGTTG